ncbi:Tar ligand binding domain-containing protein [Paraburkholderia tropica]|uniref:Tar ligand binding domain-containing protein n=1 Tax=Paraburkholderia tropica TaxID=92647 RepID=UPI003017B0C3
MFSSRISIRARIAVTMAFLAALLVMTGGLGLVGMSHTNAAYLETYTTQMPSAVQIDLTEMYAARERLTLDRAAFMAGMPDAAAALGRASELRALSEAAWKRYLAEVGRNQWRPTR